MLSARCVRWSRWLGIVGLLTGAVGVLLAETERVTDALKRAVPAEAQKSDNTGSKKETALQEWPAWEGVANVFVVPIKDEISKPNQYIVRRGLKQAIESQADAVILEIDTPGGRGDVMIDVMEQLQRFDGLTIAWVNDEAISAGAFISFAADEIWYAPDSVIGAAEVVLSSGEDIPEAMKRKINSYIQAKTRTMAEEHPYKQNVIRAMMDQAYVLEVDGKQLKGEGELLTLTASEATQLMGDPPVPLFGQGIVKDADDLLNRRFGDGHWKLTRLEITWSEVAAKYLTAISPLLIGLAFIALMVEFKTPGFGLFGSLGIALFAVVFMANYLAGLAGWEPFLILVIGFILVLVDILFLPGTVVLMIIGTCMVIGSLLWSLTDIWPVGTDGNGTGIDVNWWSLYQAGAKVSVGLIMAVAALALIWKFLPKGFIYSHLVLGGVPANGPTDMGGADGMALMPPVGSRGIAIGPLRPSGEVEINGKRYEARVSVGTLARGEPIEVIRRAQFGLEVKPIEESGP